MASAKPAPKYFSSELLEVAKKNTEMSPATWHKVMRPFCFKCMRERLNHEPQPQKA